MPISHHPNWQPWSPTPDEPWNLPRVIHLHNRAGFRATWHELQCDLADGPNASIDRVLAGKSRTDGQIENFDTHAAQSNRHANLLRDLSRSVKAFLSDLAAAKLDERVVVICFSEFGRQLGENASEGTDHGTAGPVLLAGTPVAGGIHGTAPNLCALDNNAPHHTTDFRQVYATLLENWLAIPAPQILDEEYKLLKLLKT